MIFRCSVNHSYGLSVRDVNKKTIETKAIIGIDTDQKS